MRNFEKIKNRNFIDILLGAVKIVGIMIFTWSVLIFQRGIFVSYYFKLIITTWMVFLHLNNIAHSKFFIHQYPSLLLYAFNVFSKSVQMVIGPTPFGTGEPYAAFSILSTSPTTLPLTR